jgi:DNA-binding GntR family transcriptional regulator
VRQGIFQGEFKPNQKLDQDKIAMDLGISKLPVREALIMLEGEGLVENVARHGCYVAPLTPDDIRDHYLLIGLVSGVAARRAAARITDDEINRLRLILNELDSTSEPGVQDELNFEFHRLINRAGGSRRMMAALRLFVNTMPSHFFDFATGWSSVVHQAHEQIIQALAEHDPDAAERAVIEHMKWGADIAVENLTEQGFWSSSE